MLNSFNFSINSDSVCRLDLDSILFIISLCCWFNNHFEGKPFLGVVVSVFVRKQENLFFILGVKKALHCKTEVCVCVCVCAIE